MSLFEQFYYQTLIQFDKYNTLNRNQLSLEAPEHILNLTINELVCNGYLNQSDNVFEITEDGKNYLKQNDKNPDKKELWALVLEYLSNNKAYVQKIDVSIPFLHEAATQEQRVELLRAIRDLKNQDCIDINDEMMTNFGSRMGGRMCNINQIGVKAIITEKGRKLIEPPKEEKPIVSHTYYMHGAINPIIGDNNQSSIIAETITANPTTINTTPKKNNTAKKVWLGILIAVIGGLILFLVEKLFS